MAAPKKRKSLMKRRIAHGFKVIAGKPGFKGFGISINNIYYCSYCSKPVISHFYCKCVR